MGKASITIAVSSVFNGNGITNASKSLDALNSKLSRMERITAANANSMTQNIAKYGNEMYEAGRRTEEAGKKIAAVGDALTKGVTVPMLAMGAYAGKTAVEFDTAMANVRKVTDMTDGELEKLAQSALELSTTQPVDAATIMNVEALGAQLGIAHGNLESFAKVATGLDIATNMDAETAATEMARFANIVGMAEGDMERYGSTLVAIGNNMATTESEVSQMAMRFASAGAQAGLSEAQILGMAGAMSSLGIKAEMGGSALSQIFVGIGNAVASGGDQLELFASRAGMSADEFSQAWRNDAAGAFNALIEGIGRATSEGEDMNAIMAELGYTQIRQSDVMRRLAGSTEAVTGKTSVLSDALNISTTAWEQNTALQSEVDQRNESMAARLQVLKNRVDEIAITVGRPLVDALIDASEALDPIINGVADAARAFADMDEEGQRNILMWAGVVAAAGPALSTFGRIQQVVGKGMRAWGNYASKVAVVGDAMHNLDGANLRTYASSKSLVSQVGLSGNKAVKAAGGVDRYVKAWDDMNVAAGRAKKAERGMNEALMASESASGKSRAALLRRAAALESDKIAAEEAYKKNARLVSAFGKSTTEAEKAAKGIKTLEPALESVKNGMDSSGKVLDNYNKTLKAADATSKTASLTMGQNLANGAKLAAASIGNFVKACAPMLAVTAAVTAVGAVVGHLAEQAQKAKERQDLLSAASTTFAEVSNAAALGAQSQAKGIGSIAEEARKAIEGVKVMNEQAAQAMAEFETSSATLDDYVQTITELGNRGNLSAIEQEKLKVAISGYNEIAGQSISITDESNGTLSVSTDELKKNSEEWKRNAEAQALQKIAQGYMEERVKAELALSKAQEVYSQKAAEVNALEEKRAGIADKNSVAYKMLTGEINIAKGELDKLKPSVEEASAAFESASASYDQATNMMALNSANLTKSVKDDIASQEECYQGFALAVATHLQDSGASIGTFEKNLDSLGVNTDVMRRIGEKNFMALWESCDGDVSLMVSKINEYNDTRLNDKDASVEAHGNVIDGFAKQVTDETRKKIDDLRGKNVFVDASGNYSWAKEQIWSLGNAIGSLPRYTLSVVDQIINTKRNNAAGGITPGRMAFHARGGIATRATDVTHIMGEAGAEALIPLSNKTYVRPFARAVADEFGRAGGGGNTYVVNINGVRLANSSPRALDAVLAIFEELNLVNQMGGY